MVKVDFANGSCAYLTEETYARMCAEEEAERREREWEMWAWRWLNDPANESDPCYSDIHKDYYGFRPR